MTRDGDMVQLGAQFLNFPPFSSHKLLAFCVTETGKEEQTPQSSSIPFRGLEC